jgi:single-stranded-DNA-specific exonuclease
MSEKRYFLDVRKSATGLAWEHRLDRRQENVALAIAQRHGITDLVARVLAARGVSEDAAPGFLEPTIRDLLPDPQSVTDLDKGAARLAAAIRRREPVAIFGDYDVDGACASALLARYLRAYGIDAPIYIPDRIFEGYGPNPDAMRELVANGASLIVTVDCGTNSAASIAAANEAGAEVVVIDHHQVAGPLPDAVAIVNPNREDDISGQGHLCATGVVFLTLVRVARLLAGSPDAPRARAPDLLSMLDLVALATVCDVVPLVGVNRAFVVKGLLAMRQMTNPGIAALAQAARIGEPLNGFHLGYVLGPRINAGGRIGDAALGSRLLMSDDVSEARAIAEQLDRLNAERQAMERVMLEAARAEAEAELVSGQGPAVIVTGSDEWHPGIVGLLASRLKEQTRRPAFAIAFNVNGIGTGSGRSIGGIDLGSLVRGAIEAGHLIKGGGHAMAAGITIERSRLGAFRAFLEERAADEVTRLREADALRIDAALAADGANLSLVDMLEHAGPYGAGHPAPMLALPHHMVADVRPVGQSHLRVELRSQTGARIQAMAFRAADTDLGRFLGTMRGRRIHAAGTLGSNHWNGLQSVQFRITDAAEAK